MNDDAAATQSTETDYLLTVDSALTAAEFEPLLALLAADQSRL